MTSGLALDPVVAIALRFAGALLFILASAHKWRDLRRFEVALDAYALLPRRALRAAAPVFAGLEALIGLLLLVPVSGPWPALAGAALLGIYGLAVAINLARGRTEIACGCGGLAGEQPIGGALVARNVALLSLLSLAALETVPRPLVWVDAITVTGAVAALALIHVAWDLAILNSGRQRSRV